MLKKVNKAIEALHKFHDEVKRDWSSSNQRFLGHVVRSPPITFNCGTEGFTEDYAVVALDRTKIKKAFKGNVIDLGMEISRDKFNNMMCPRYLSTPPSQLQVS
ncbi:hypothetical protein C0995_002977 [Termitomyces sp. Mi166|nr:hypothetical protein C0995_002977 [Termitomyces sp. Mi166\